MQQQFYKPHPLLQDFVNDVMIVGADFSELESPVICPFPPMPQHCIYFYVNDAIAGQKVGETAFVTKASSIIVGPQLTRVNLNLNKKHLMVCVSFHPGGLYRLLGIPMTEIFDNDFETSLLLDGEINLINEQLKAAISWSQMNEIVQSFLLTKLPKLKASLPFDEAMKLLQQSNGQMSIDAVASLACLSVRQFERKCKERIGLPPKLFARLIRFSKAYRLKESTPSANWTSIAYHSGYFDQMHMIRDFKEFAGVTPTILEADIHKAPVQLQINHRL